MEIVYAFGWIVCSAGSYMLNRAAFRRNVGSWTAGDRAITGSISILFGPLALLSLLVMMAMVFAITRMTKEVNW